MNRFQNLRHKRQVINTPRRIEELVRELLFLVLFVHGESEFRDEDGLAERVPEVVEVFAEVGGRYVDVAMGAIADIPAVDVFGFLEDAVREERVGGGMVCCAVGECFCWFGDYGCCIWVDAKEVGGVADVR